MSKTIKMSCVAFTGESRAIHTIAVDEDKTIRVYDSVAGHYTRNHGLSPRSQAAAFRKAYGPHA